MTVPTHRGRLRSADPATETAIGTSTVIVPTLVPIAMEMMHAITKMPGTARLPGMTLSSMFAVLSTPPAALAMPENAPAMRKINSMMVMLSSPMPWAQKWIFSSKLTRRFWQNATIKAMANATTTEMT